MKTSRKITAPAKREVPIEAKLAAAEKREQAREEKRIERERVLDAERAAYQATLNRLTAGLERCTAMPGDWNRVVMGGEVATCIDTYRKRLRFMTVDGEAAYLEDSHGYDEDRQCIFVSPVLAREFRLELARKHEVTVEGAKDWLANYEGCEGTDIYLEVVKAAENQ